MYDLDSKKKMRGEVMKSTQSWNKAGEEGWGQGEMLKHLSHFAFILQDEKTPFSFLSTHD